MTISTATFVGYISNGTSGTAGTILTVNSLSNGIIQLGMAVSASGITANTHILAFLTGTGGTGTYTVSISQASGTSGSPLTISGTTASLLLAADYNYIQNITSTVMGVGSGTYGYSQTLGAPSTVSVGSIPTATQWSGINQDLANAYTHQGLIGGLTIPSAPVAKTTVITGTDFSNYLALAASIYTNSLVIGGNQASLVNLQSGNQGQFTGTQWNTLVTHTLVMTWVSNSKLRGFWNSGGQIRISASLTPGTNSAPGYAKELDWQMLLTNMGTITMNYNTVSTTGSYTILNSSAGYFGLTNSPTNIFQKATSSPTYSTNQYDIYVTLNGTPATATAMTFSIQFQDNNHPGGYGIDEYISSDSILQSNVYAYYASGAYVQAALPSISNSISGS
jgi:hypothetical protein